MDVHAPYRSDSIDPPGARSRVEGDGVLDDETLEKAYRMQGLAGPGVEERAIELYDAGIRSLDAALEELLRKIGRHLPAENTLVVVTSDHGEAFREHGTTEHGGNLYPEVVGVPLLFSWPGVLPEGVRIGAQVRSIDIAPTVLALADMNVPKAFEGMPLLPMLAGQIEDRIGRSEVYFRRPLSPFHFAAVVSRDHLYVREKMNGRVEFFDLRSDPRNSRT